MQAPARVQFEGLAEPVAFEGCDALLDQLAAISAGWRWSAIDTPLPPAITVSAEAGGWRIASRWLPKPAFYDDVTDILCALIADLILAHVEARNAAGGRLLCLHAAAVAIGQNQNAPLFVFPAMSEAGKSTLAAALAAAGGRLYSDDVLPVDLPAVHESGATADARAIGIAPRPRLPLPEALPASLRAHLTRHMALANSRHGYVALPRERIAPLGERRPIAAFVQLERVPQEHASLTSAPRSEIMALLLRQNFGAHPPAGELVERFAALTATARCWRLRYSDIGEAVAVLTAEALNAARRLSA